MVDNINACIHKSECFGNYLWKNVLSTNRKKNPCTPNIQKWFLWKQKKRILVIMIPILVRIISVNIILIVMVNTTMIKILNTLVMQETMIMKKSYILTIVAK